MLSLETINKIIETKNKKEKRMGWGIFKFYEGKKKIGIAFLGLRLNLHCRYQKLIEPDRVGGIIIIFLVS